MHCAPMSSGSIRKSTDMRQRKSLFPELIVYWMLNLIRVYIITLFKFFLLPWWCLWFLHYSIFLSFWLGFGPESTNKMCNEKCWEYTSCSWRVRKFKTCLSAIILTFQTCTPIFCTKILVNETKRERATHLIN